MGETAEDYRNTGAAGAGAGDALWEQQARDCAAGLWRTHKGLTIPVTAMAESHLRNALALLRRKGFIGCGTLKAYLRGPEPRGEMAQQAFAEELDQVLNARVNPYVDLLADEMKRRGLTEVRP